MSTQDDTTTATAKTATAQKQRTRCEVWTRVMGYHRPVQNFNVGKKSEHYSRRHFSEGKSCGSKLAKAA
ncbi:MAG: anaerobic ribonucleoside-triphosphate reductase [Candidatus Peribacteraceae bacterium]|nr:anaerobic ribonucleoside-triphosphate reductase [Candidatus Peribacteraceae bacterium]